jgi:hypothetical protein
VIGSAHDFVVTVVHDLEAGSLGERLNGSLLVLLTVLVGSHVRCRCGPEIGTALINSLRLMARRPVPVAVSQSVMVSMAQASSMFTTPRGSRVSVWITDAAWQCGAGGTVLPRRRSRGSLDVACFTRVRCSLIASLRMARLLLEVAQAEETHSSGFRPGRRAKFGPLWMLRFCGIGQMSVTARNGSGSLWRSSKASTSCHRSLPNPKNTRPQNSQPDPEGLPFGLAWNSKG